MHPLAQGVLLSPGRRGRDDGRQSIEQTAAALMQGLPAVAAREAVEARWDLLLRGVDSFAAF